jgi:hypothetical protein
MSKGEIEMTKQVVSNWFGKLGESERNLPLLIYQGGVYSPRMAYDEVMRSSPLGDALQSLIEQRSFGTTSTDEQTVAKLRLTEIMRTKPDKPLFATLSNKVFTPSQLLEEIQNDTDIGRQWVGTEISHMRRIVSVR